MMMMMMVICRRYEIERGKYNFSQMIIFFLLLLLYIIYGNI
jgi:hypothetical protein